ncbi:hypothetical protein [Yokenella regensburgei]|uniref:hypothetical protein n=1 Tax=Yokenella regensburgei TaxID=158877 RepID=UPI001375C113|nr:hypothetical protein [Yokenella regensburgei]KAF1366700.1 hypothetical protein FHR25_004848 [Yokenella regensburgei]
MKTFIKIQLRNEILGQAILEIIFQKGRISETALLKQLRMMHKSVTDPTRQEVLHHLIKEFTDRKKKIASGTLFSNVDSGKQSEGEESDDELIQTIVSRHLNKLH